MRREFWVVRSVGVRSLAAPGLILLFIFASDAFAAGDAGQMQARDGANKDLVTRPGVAPDLDGAYGMVVPLDHGPRATTTPWLNQQRRLKAAAATSAAKAPSAVDSGTAALGQH